MRSLPESWKLAHKRRRKRHEEAKRVLQDKPESDLCAEMAGPDAIWFEENRLGFKPTDYQRKFLEDDKQFQALRWCRQSGKSFTASVKILWFALHFRGFQWAVVGPSFRQSKLIIRRINALLLKLTKEVLVDRKSLRTKVAFINGSVIEAYPNNPDTIRGPTLNGIYADEFNFFKDDEEIYDAILFTLGTTNGMLMATSTPWSRDHIFYKMCKDKEYDDFSRHHVNWERAVEPNGPLKKNILEKIRKQLAADSWRWQREMEAEWAEDDNVWLSQSLITSCIDSDMEIRIVDRQKSFWVVEAS